jgi:hypothetical protein
VGVGGCDCFGFWFFLGFLGFLDGILMLLFIFYLLFFYDWHFMVRLF